MCIFYIYKTYKICITFKLCVWTDYYTRVTKALEIDLNVTTVYVKKSIVCDVSGVQSIVGKNRCDPTRCRSTAWCFWRSAVQVLSFLCSCCLLSSGGYFGSLHYYSGIYIMFLVCARVFYPSSTKIIHFSYLSFIKRRELIYTEVSVNQRN